MEDSLISPAFLNNVADRLREFANQIDNINQEIDNFDLQSNKKNALLYIEKNSSLFIESAKAEYVSREKRFSNISPSLLGEPAWDMLLDLFISRLSKRRVSVTSVCIASHAPSTTGLRYLRALEVEGYVERIRSSFDQRVSFIELTESGVIAVAAYFLRAPVQAKSAAKINENEQALINDRSPPGQGPR